MRARILGSGEKVGLMKSVNDVRYITSQPRTLFFLCHTHTRGFSLSDSLLKTFCAPCFSFQHSCRQFLVVITCACMPLRTCACLLTTVKPDAGAHARKQGRRPQALWSVLPTDRLHPPQVLVFLHACLHQTGRILYSTNFYLKFNLPSIILPSPLFLRMPPP